MLYAAVCCSLIIFGTSLFIHTEPSSSFFGATLIVIVLPFTFTKILENFLLSQRYVTLDYPRFYGVSVIQTGIGFLLMQLFVASFSVPNLAPSLVGRLDIIMWTQILFILISIISGEIYLIQYGLKYEYTGEGFIRTDKIRAYVRLSVVLATVLVAFVATRNSSLNIECNKLEIKALISNENEVFNSSSNCTQIRVMTWNVLLGHQMSGKDNTKCVSTVIDHFQPQIAALQESDPLPVYWGGKNYLAAVATGLKSYKVLQGVPPKSSSLGVGLMSKLEVLSHKASLLPVELPNKVPHYAYTKTIFKICSSINSRLHVITVHAVYKNWTDDGSLDNLSNKQVSKIATEADSVDPKDAVIVMGDFNLNPYEEQITYLKCKGRLESAVYPRNLDTTSTLDAWTNIDNIFYRNLNLNPENTKILSEIGPISDHLPVVADFVFDKNLYTNHTSKTLVC